MIHQDAIRKICLAIQKQQQIHAIFTQQRKYFISAVLPLSRIYTYDDYLGWEGKWELINGVPHAMSRAPIPKHQLISNLVSYEFTDVLRRCKQKKKSKVYQLIDYKISDTTVFQPDVLIVCKDITKRFLDFPPALVIEILSPSTELFDRFTKYPIYEQQGIAHYLMISPDDELVEVYELENGRYQLRKKEHAFTYTFRLEECEATVDFSEIWQSFFYSLLWLTFFICNHRIPIFKVL